jgi:uncharacterized protein (TIRG00374 family)
MLVGAAILYWYLSGFTPEELSEIWDNIKHVKIKWLIFSLIMGLLSHIIRAYRWNYLLETLNYHPKKINLILTVGISYLLNLVVPRAGEVARAGSLSKYEKNISFDKAFGTIVAERMADVLFLLFFIFLALILQFDFIYKMIEPKLPDSYLILGIELIVVAFLFYLLFRWLGHSKNPFVLKIKGFITGLLHGMSSILKMPNKWWFILQTTLIWALYVGMFWIVLPAFPETANLGFEAVLVGFIAGSIAMVISNGGFGVYPVFVAAALSLYGVSKATGTAFGLLMWTTQTLLVIIFGLICLFLLPIVNKKSGSEAGYQINN